MLTSSPLHTDTYPASATFPPLSKDLFSNAGTMLTVRAGSMTLCSSMDMLVSGVGCPLASTKILVDIRYVCMNGSPTIPAWYVHAVSHADEGITPSSNPLLTCCSVSSVCLWRAPFLVRGWRRNAALYLSVWCGGIANCTIRLPLLEPVGLALARARTGPCG